MKTTQADIDRWNRAQRAWMALRVDGHRTEHGKRVMAAVAKTPQHYLVRHGSDGYGVHYMASPQFARPVPLDIARECAAKCGIPTDFCWTTEGQWELLG